VLAGRVLRQLHFLGVPTALAQLHAGTQVVAQRLRLRAEVLEEVVLLVDRFLQVVNQVLLARLQVLDALLVRLGDLESLVGLVNAAVADALLVDLSVFALFRPRLHLPTVYVSCPLRCIMEVICRLMLILLKHLVDILLVIQPRTMIPIINLKLLLLYVSLYIFSFLFSLHHV
jgi:hypothetical protein